MVTNNAINVPTGASGTMLQGAGVGTAPAFSTSTYPATNAISTLLYASSANVMAALTTANNGLLVTSSTGVPSVLAGPGTTGNILQSNAAAAPSFSTATFPATATSTGTILRADGTNWVATTATYPATTTSQQILYSTAANVVGQLTTANSALAATNSSGTLAMRLFSVVTQVFTSTGTYTPTAGMLYCIIELVGGGGGGGATATTNGVQISAGGGGGGGGYSRKTVSAATIGASQSVTVGNGGTAGAVSAGSGGTGGTVSVGAIISATGGAGGGGSGAGGGNAANGGAGGVGSSGDLNTNGGAGGVGGGSGLASGSFAISGFGGSSYFGGNTAGIGGLSGQAAGNAGVNYGSGGSGGLCGVSGTQSAGGAGAKGVVIITEYVIA